MTHSSQHSSRFSKISLKREEITFYCFSIEKIQQVSSDKIRNYPKNSKKCFSHATPSPWVDTRIFLMSFRRKIVKRSPPEEIFGQAIPPEPEKIARYLVLSAQKGKK